ncbi:MAG: nucleotidyltransferase family protein [Chloroflexi bacterium]|nr:nucleotidyltransferase family protein [Chloroflexota bacterium]
MSLYRTLALSARAQMPPALHGVLAAVASRVDAASLVEAAEQHGLAPLVYSHLSDAGALPPGAQRPLAALTLRHRQAAAARAQALAEVLHLFAREQIDVLVLKGAALAHLVYPSPDLRPMRDVDLLVRAPDAERAWRLLAQAGFALPESPAHGLPARHHHLASAKRPMQGTTISIEIHQCVSLNEPRRAPRTYDDWAAGSLPFEFGGAAARAPAREELLWHVYRHALCMPLGYEPLRLVWIADLTSLVERWATVLDWDIIKRQYRAVWRTLAHLDALTPWSDAVRPYLPPRAEYPADAAEQIVASWPRFAPERPLRQSLPRIARNVLAPPAWWLRVRYGADATATGTAGAWLRHQWTAWTQAARFPFEPVGR